MNVTFRQLKVFLEVAERGSVSRAAAALHLTPPAVSMQVKELEAQVALPLFDRAGGRLTLSSAGEHFLVHARRLLGALKDAETSMSRFSRLEQGALVIGIVSTAKYFVPRLIARFHAEHPGVELKLRVAGNREKLIEWMRTGDIDLAVMGRPPRDLTTRAEAFAAHPLVFVCAAGHRLSAAAPLAVDALDGEPLIVREPGSGTRDAFDVWCAERRFAPRIAMDMPSNETIKQAVIAGMGLSFLSLHTVGLELQSALLAVLRVEGTPVMRTWNVVHLQARGLSPAAEAFRAFMLEAAEPFLAAHDAPWLARPA